MSWGEDDTIFEVVINVEEQYSIWPIRSEIPAGWRTGGKRGRKAECLAHIDTVWTDMRPLSLRQAMAAREHASARPSRDQRMVATDVDAAHAI